MSVRDVHRAHYNVGNDVARIDAAGPEALMEHLAFDPFVVAALAMSLLLIVCIGILALMRDPQRESPHLVSLPVWCSAHHCRVDVQFVQHTSTGLTFRSVVRCPLRADGESCSEECAYPPEADSIDRSASEAVRRLYAAR